ncbi:RNA polymerase sigma factor [Geobacter sp. FeAm09]|uniref:RNA polymerase sigma factor n=1 Tax=Geobacter sp. FeAm09 TaxID=2597769 RepID=UPI001F0DD68F|nr:RNA polymerase sigma factor [Geobacter sp. FeAm09]
MPEQTSDESLISATLAGDDGAYARLVTRYKRRIFALTARFARDSDELEDICQEVFIKAFENLASFRHDAPFEHWLTRIAVRASHDALRRRRREKGQSGFDDYVFEVRDSAEEAHREAREAREVLKWAFTRLKADERIVITLLELEGHSVREISALTGWSETNVKVRAHRARQVLKRVLEESDER